MRRLETGRVLSGVHKQRTVACHIPIRVYAATTEVVWTEPLSWNSIGCVLIANASLFEDSIDNFINIPGIMIVFSGTLASLLLTFPFESAFAAIQATYYVDSYMQRAPNGVVATMIELCKISRRKGLLELSNIKTDSVLLKKPCTLIARGADEAALRKCLAYRD